MSEKRSLLNGNSSMFSQNIPMSAPAAPQTPAPTPNTSVMPTPAPPKKTPRQQVKFYTEQEPYEAFKRAHRLEQVHDDSLGSLSDHLNRLMIQETERINNKYGQGEDRAS